MSMDPVPTLGSMDRPVSFTLDFEDLRTDPTVQEERVGIVTDRILARRKRFFRNLPEQRSRFIERLSIR